MLSFVILPSAPRTGVMLNLLFCPFNRAELPYLLVLDKNESDVKLPKL